MTKSNTCLFATVLCLVPENFLRAPVKITGNVLAAGVASYFTVKSTDIFCNVQDYYSRKQLVRALALGK